MSKRHATGTRAWRSLGARLALLYAVVTAASFAAVAAVFALRVESSVEHEGQRSAETTLQRYRDALESGGYEALRALFNGDVVVQRSYSVRLTNASDVALFQISSDDASSRVAAESRKQGGSGQLAPHVPREWHAAVAHVSHGRQLEVLVHDDTAPRLWRHAREAAWSIFACGLVSSIVGGFVISRRALRPVSDLARATQRIIESGDLGLRVAERASGDDLDQLGQLFNRMLARTETLVRAMKESLDNVAHDLRTPLTRLRAGAELALRAPNDPGASREALADVVEESDRVLGMLTTLMDISEAETGAMRLDRRAEDLSQIVREAVELYDLVASERAIEVTTKLAASEVWVDRRRILQVCANLLDNALKYTPPGGRVVVSVKPEGEWVVLSISDSGVGIAAEDQPRVWDRLFRADKSRAQRGLGLGLSLVKAVVEAHGGSVRVFSQLGVGSTFEVLFERAQDGEERARP